MCQQRLLLIFSLLFLSASSGARECSPPPAPRSVPVAAQGHIALASLNLWRLRDDRKDARYDDPIDTGLLQERLDVLARHITDQLSSPHLIAVQEVESLDLLRGLARAVAAAGGPQYRAFLREGNDPSGIDVGLMVRDPVKLAGTRQLFDGLKASAGHALFSRPPLHAVLSDPFPADLVVVHLKSGRGLGEPEVRLRRERQARQLRDWSLIRHEAGRAVILAGDFNSAGDGVYGEPAQLLSSEPFHSIWQLLPQDERYSFVYRCRPQAIDNIIFNAPVRARVTGAHVSRGEAGHYDALYGGEGSGEVVTDHDSPVLYLQIKSPLP